MENFKKCPFCGSEINSNAKKCRFCNNWLDEEIECPFCAEKIKASAQKCRFCGEWLPKKKDNKLKFNFSLKKLFAGKIKLIIATILVVFVLIVSALCLYFYVPQCNNNTILNNLTLYLKNTISNIGDKDIFIEKYSVKQLSKDNQGYTCAATAIIDNRSIDIEYSYKKKSLKDYNIESKFVLPDCFQESTNNILIQLIQKSKYLDIDKIADKIEIEYASTEKSEEDIPKYFSTICIINSEECNNNS